MIAERVEEPATTAATHRATFFRQSGWLMIATIGGGVFMTAVHFLSKAIPKGEYGQFGAFLAVAMFVPATPLQMVLARQTARALALGREHELSGIIRATWLGTFVVWLLGALVVLLFQGAILAQWKVSNPASLWVTLPVLLFTAWIPMFWGVLQGQQNFLWFGWSQMIQGVGRLGVAAFLVLVLHAYATGMVAGMLGGLALALVFAIWPTRSLWLSAPQPFDWRDLLREVIPLTVGSAMFQFMLTADTMFVRACMTEDQSAFYVSAGTLSRASMWLVGPLATVMFPKIVHSAARKEKSDLLGVVLLGTLIFAAGGATGLWVFGPWAIKLMFRPDYVKEATALLPWYAWAVVPLALANVLLNNLLARSRFSLVPALCVLAACYAFALSRFHDTPIAVIKTLGVFNVLMLGICAWFTWGARVQSPESRVQA
jgi:O-antigen/teichoic acid export membrane protein